MVKYFIASLDYCAYAMEYAWSDNKKSLSQNLPFMIYKKRLDHQFKVPTFKFTPVFNYVSGYTSPPLKSPSAKHLADIVGELLISIEFGSAFIHCQLAWSPQATRCTDYGDSGIRSSRGWWEDF